MTEAEKTFLILWFLCLGVYGTSFLPPLPFLKRIYQPRPLPPVLYDWEREPTDEGDLWQ